MSLARRLTGIVPEERSGESHGKEEEEMEVEVRLKKPGKRYKDQVGSLIFIFIYTYLYYIYYANLYYIYYANNVFMIKSIIVRTVSPFFLTFRDHLHIFVIQSSPSFSSTACFQSCHLSIHICSYLPGCAGCC